MAKANWIGIDKFFNLLKIIKQNGGVFGSLRTLYRFVLKYKLLTILLYQKYFKFYVI